MRVIIALLLLVGCGSNEDDTSDELEIIGTYTTQFNTTETITELKWNSASIVSYDNDDNLAIVQNPADDMFFPDKFSRVVWIEPAADRSFYYCTVAFGLDTVEQAETSTQTADRSAPETTGCGGFSWTKMSPSS